MFSKEDMYDYLNKFYELENQMVNKYEYLSSHVDDQKLKSIFSSLIVSEKKHTERITRIKEIISGMNDS